MGSNPAVTNMLHSCTLTQLLHSTQLNKWVPVFFKSVFAQTRPTHIFSKTLFFKRLKKKNIYGEKNVCWIAKYITKLSQPLLLPVEHHTGVNSRS